VRLRFGGFLVAALLVLGGGSVSLAQEVTPEFVQETIVKANQGIARAQYNLGVLYVNGEGVRQDKVKAREWYEQAAVQGHVRAYYNLGVMYINGEGGGLQNMKTAKEWFGKACDRGLQLGCDAYRELNEASH